jgi:hypothetical protein
MVTRRATATRRSVRSRVSLRRCLFRRLCGGLEGDVVAHRGQVGDVVADLSISVDPGGMVVGAEVAEPGGGVVEEVPDDDQDGAGEVCLS